MVELRGFEPLTPCCATTGSPVSSCIESTGVVSDRLRSGLGHGRDPLGV